MSNTSSVQPIRIFCYGDSLTAGTAPPMDQLYPYALYLEQALNNMYPDGTTVIVRWRGLPGWTASTMMEYLDDSSVGLRSAVNGIRDPSLSLVILLVGTNDIGMLTSSLSGGEVDNIEEAIDPILNLHMACLDSDTRDSATQNRIRTLAVGIPGSAWQQNNLSAKNLCNDMNDRLEKFASNCDGRVSYVNFPFKYAKDDPKWCSDGLHLSPEGYEVLGVELAKSVKNILDS